MKLADWQLWWSIRPRRQRPIIYRPYSEDGLPRDERLVYHPGGIVVYESLIDRDPETWARYPMPSDLRERAETLMEGWSTG